MRVLLENKTFRHLNERQRAPCKHQERSSHELNPEKLHFRTAVKFPAKPARSSCPSQIQSCFHRALNESYFQNVSHVLLLANYVRKPNQGLISFFPQQSAFNISLALGNFTAIWHKWTLEKALSSFCLNSYGPSLCFFSFLFLDSALCIAGL